MGGRLSPVMDDTAAPRFYIRAMQDPQSTGIHRVQMIKGWLDERGQQERVQDIACGSGQPPVSGRCPAPESSVDLSTCSISGDSGAASLETIWQDDDFHPQQRAFYYVRVLQNPTCRWSSYDAIRLSLEPLPEVPPIVQERAWSSPIWYSPGQLGGL